VSGDGAGLVELVDDAGGDRAELEVLVHESRRITSKEVSSVNAYRCIRAYVAASRAAGRSVTGRPGQDAPIRQMR
jgi:hypothetical protein